MSKIDELLKNEKVEWKKLGDVSEVGTGKSNTNEQIEDGEYPFYVRSKNIKRSNKYEFDEIAIVIPGEGGIGDVFHYVEGKYALHQRAYRIHIIDDKIITKFVYHYMLNNFKKYIMKNAVSATVSSIRKPMIENFEIPIPSIETQEKIVKTLDKFTNYVTELQTELQSRTKQYEYYRDMLLSEEYLNKISKEIKGHGKDYEVKVTTLGECVNIILGGTPNKDKNEYWDNGTIPWMSSGEVNKKTVYNTNSFITQKGYDNSSATMVPKNSTVIALAGQGKTRGLVARIKIELTTNQSLATLIPSKNLNNDYLYYYLTGQYLKLREVSSGDGSRGGLNKEILKKYQILVPSVKVQERIVSILDKFDSIVNDISKGLPKEIELRQKQYEHYREKLLTFEK
ncbi:MAG: restriction endonuclease subunit S [Parvimonas sp.]|nr:restriction endonuclease subunit S [Parvimonas sp.]